MSLIIIFDEGFIDRHIGIAVKLFSELARSPDGEATFNNSVVALKAKLEQVGEALKMGKAQQAVDSDSFKSYLDDAERDLQQVEKGGWKAFSLILNADLIMAMASAEVILRGMEHQLLRFISHQAPPT